MLASCKGVAQQTFSAYTQFVLRLTVFVRLLDKVDLYDSDMTGMIITCVNEPCPPTRFFYPIKFNKEKK
jgi:hypothetical protein